MNSEPSTESIPALPDDLIYEIIEACDLLPTQRHETLGSLSRLAKRFAEAAQRVLWHEITINPNPRRFAQLCKKLQRRPAWKAQVPAYYSSNRRYMRALPHLPDLQQEFDVEALRSIVSAAKSTLVSIGLPISGLLQAVEPTEFPRLRELVLYGSPSPPAPTPGDIPLVNAFFLSCAALPFLAALRLHLRRHPSSSFPTGPGSSCALSFLALVPPRIEHLDLTDSTFSRADLEAFFYGATRPARLRTLRWDETTLEGGAEQSKSEDEDEEENWRERLREKLAEWGVEVTTLKPWW
ncbi:hypothetical protein Rhopal_005350-T1 [Rhodotorula paludigena]|uniref:F-box domain-containing protein n=1 Tax=Rhodotorula paludigena TaxID=86838 RepID=A0AAV5GR03_9BASI|nr:hypothetical protein Rhopal_005350-T1 [Rhodotorula paludigena]